MDAANEKNSLIPASAKSTSGEPGADSKVHEQNLQQGVAENLPQPFDVSPSEQEESFVEKVGEDLEALNPFDPKTVRTAPNTDKKRGGFLNLLLGRIRKQHPENEIKEK